MTPLQRLQVFHIYNNAEVFYNRHKYTISCIDKDWETIDLYDKEADEFIIEVDIDTVQLILRGIDQITEEEKRELANIAGVEEKYADDCAIGIRASHRLENTWVFRHSSTQKIIDAADYLRSKNIALPYMGIDLFKEGIAVREN